MRPNFTNPLLSVIAADIPHVRGSVRKAPSSRDLTAYEWQDDRDDKTPFDRSAYQRRSPDWEKSQIFTTIMTDAGEFQDRIPRSSSHGPIGQLGTRRSIAISWEKLFAGRPQQAAVGHLSRFSAALPCAARVISSTLHFTRLPRSRSFVPAAPVNDLAHAAPQYPNFITQRAAP
jgi:hypothetical protein